MQKVVDFLEKNVQWVALGLSGVVFLLMVWIYVVKSPVTVTVAGKELTPGDVQFVDNSAFPKGGQTAVVYGDPAKPGLFIIRAKFPPNYVVPPHIHPVFESVTVLSGSMGSGMGKTVDKSQGKMLGPGSLLLFVSPDGASFELRLVGLSEGLPQVLRDETGGPVVLRGLYNPNLPAPSSP